PLPLVALSHREFACMRITALLPLKYGAASQLVTSCVRARDTTETASPGTQSPQQPMTAHVHSAFSIQPRSWFVARTGWTPAPLAMTFQTVALVQEPLLRRIALALVVLDASTHTSVPPLSHAAR